MPNPHVLHLAVCLFPDVTALDYQGPIELLSFISPKNLERNAVRFEESLPFAIEPTYLSYTLDLVEPKSGPLVQPSDTYERAVTLRQFDIILVPGGAGARPDKVKQPLLDFLQKQAPGAKYILSVCTGAWILATAGILNGKRATSNKAALNTIKEATKDLQISWIGKARWVVDDDYRLWTSSGVTAGMDLAAAFLQHLIGEANAQVISRTMELSVRGEGDDEFFAHYGLSDT